MKPDTVVFIAIGLLAVMAVGLVFGFAALVVDVAVKISEALNP